MIPRMYKTYHTRYIHGAQRSRSPGKWLLCDRSSSFKHVKHVIFYPWKLLQIITIYYLKLKRLILFYQLLNHQYLTCSLDNWSKRVWLVKIHFMLIKSHPPLLKKLYLKVTFLNSFLIVHFFFYHSKHR